MQTTSPKAETASSFRSQFSDFGSTVFLDCANQGPFPLTAAKRAQEAITLKCRPERLQPREYFELPRRVRSRLERIVGAQSDEIALSSGATQGIGIVATGLQLQPGDEVVVADNNFPSNLFTWVHMRKRGVRVHVLKTNGGPVSPDAVERVLSPRTRVLALDWVSYLTGARIDLQVLGELAHAHNARFVVDGTQGVGAIEFDFSRLPVDVLSVAAYKWLLGPYGTGFVCVKRDALAKLNLEVVNWLSVDGADDFDSLPVEDFSLPREARVFDVPETANFLNLNAFEASLDFVLEAGVKTVTRHCTRLLQSAAEGLRMKGYEVTAQNHELPSTILTFRAPSDEATSRTYSDLKKHQVEVSMRHGLIRVSPYLYNNDQDIARLLEFCTALGHQRL